MDDNKNIPTTIADAVNILLSELTLDDKKRIKDTTEDNLHNFNFGLGMTIRTIFGLWKEDSKLLEDCKQVSGNSNLHIDDSSEMIIKALWDRLQGFPPPKSL